MISIGERRVNPTQLITLPRLKVRLYPVEENQVFNVNMAFPEVLSSKHTKKRSARYNIPKTTSIGLMLENGDICDHRDRFWNQVYQEFCPEITHQKCETSNPSTDPPKTSQREFGYHTLPPKSTQPLMMKPQPTWFYDVESDTVTWVCPGYPSKGYESSPQDDPMKIKLPNYDPISLPIKKREKFDPSQFITHSGTRIRFHPKIGRDFPDVNMVFTETITPQMVRKRSTRWNDPESSRAAEYDYSQDCTCKRRDCKWNAHLKEQKAAQRWQGRYGTVHLNDDLLKVSQDGFSLYVLTPMNKSLVVAKFKIKQEPTWFPGAETCSDNQTIADMTLEGYYDATIMERMKKISITPTKKRKFDPSQFITPPGTRIQLQLGGKSYFADVNMVFTTGGPSEEPIAQNDAGEPSVKEEAPTSTAEPVVPVIGFYPDGSPISQENTESGHVW